MTQVRTFGAFDAITVKYGYCSEIHEVGGSGAHHAYVVTLEEVTIREIVPHGRRIRREHEPTPAEILKPDEE